MAKAKKKKKTKTKQKSRQKKKTKAKAPKAARKKKKNKKVARKKKATRKPKAKPLAEPSRVANDVGVADDRRRHPRVPFLRTVRYSFDDVESFEEKHAADISMGGMFIQTEAPEPTGTVLHFAFEASGNKIFAGFARVVRVNEPGEDDQDVGMGIEFLKLDDDSKEALRDLLSR